MIEINNPKSARECRVNSILSRLKDTPEEVILRIRRNAERICGTSDLNGLLRYGEERGWVKMAPASSLQEEQEAQEQAQQPQPSTEPETETENERTPTE
jgi:hypothetical protein